MNAFGILKVLQHHAEGPPRCAHEREPAQSNLHLIEQDEEERKKEKTKKTKEVRYGIIGVERIRCGSLHVPSPARKKYHFL